MINSLFQRDYYSSRFNFRVYTDQTKYSTTIATEFFPFYIAVIHKFSSRYISDRSPVVNPLLEGEYLYSKIHQKDTLPISIRGNYYKRIFDSLVYHVTMTKIAFKLPKDENPLILTETLNVATGFISDTNNNILLMLTTKSLDIFKEGNNNNDTFDYELDYESLRLYVSTNFAQNSRYKNLYKKIYTEYISYCYSKGVEVIFTTSNKIEKRTLVSPLNLSFSSLGEMKEHLKTVSEGMVNLMGITPVLSLEEEPIALYWEKFRNMYREQRRERELQVALEIQERAEEEAERLEAETERLEEEAEALGDRSYDITTSTESTQEVLSEETRPGIEGSEFEVILNGSNFTTTGSEIVPEEIVSNAEDLEGGYL